jgi:hypothetical protein
MEGVLEPPHRSLHAPLVGCHATQLTFDRVAFVPEGRHENSPAFQRWDTGAFENSSPGGTAEIQSSLRDFGAFLLHHPSVETLGYFRNVPLGR